MYMYTLEIGEPEKCVAHPPAYVQHLLQLPCLPRLPHPPAYVQHLLVNSNAACLPGLWVNLDRQVHKWRKIKSSWHFWRNIMAFPDDGWADGISGPTFTRHWYSIVDMMLCPASTPSPFFKTQAGSLLWHSEIDALHALNVLDLIRQTLVWYTMCTQRNAQNLKIDAKYKQHFNLTVYLKLYHTYRIDRKV